MPRWLENWLVRHQHPASRLLHLVGIPMLPLAAVLIVVQWSAGAWHLWWRPVGLIVASYLLQWIGHRIEGNDMGEVILVKKLAGRPYTAIAPRYRTASNQGRANNAISNAGHESQATPTQGPGK